jgi:Chlorophyll A-B binding protein
VPDLHQPWAYSVHVNLQFVSPGWEHWQRGAMQRRARTCSPVRQPLGSTRAYPDATSIPNVTAAGVRSQRSTINFQHERTWLQVKRYREAELTHGRVCMLAALGFLFGEAVQDKTIFYNWDGNIRSAREHRCALARQPSPGLCKFVHCAVHCLSCSCQCMQHALDRMRCRSPNAETPQSARVALTHKQQACEVCWSPAALHWRPSEVAGSTLQTYVSARAQARRSCTSSRRARASTSRCCSLSAWQRRAASRSAGPIPRPSPCSRSRMRTSPATLGALRVQSQRWPLMQGREAHRFAVRTCSIARLRHVLSGAWSAAERSSPSAAERAGAACASAFDRRSPRCTRPRVACAPAALSDHLETRVHAGSTRAARGRATRPCSHSSPPEVTCVQVRPVNPG